MPENELYKMLLLWVVDPGDLAPVCMPNTRH